VACYTIG